MKTTASKMKQVLAATCIALAGACAGNASAASLIGSLGTAATAKDIFKLECRPGTAQVFFRVEDLPPVGAPWVRVTMNKGGQELRSTDQGDADGVYSTDRRLKMGAGVYTLTVEKVGPVKSGAENYFVHYACENVANIEIPKVNIYPIRNK